MPPPTLYHRNQDPNCRSARHHRESASIHTDSQLVCGSGECRGQDRIRKMQCGTSVETKLGHMYSPAGCKCLGVVSHNPISWVVHNACNFVPRYFRTQHFESWPFWSLFPCSHCLTDFIPQGPQSVTKCVHHFCLM